MVQAVADVARPVDRWQEAGHSVRWMQDLPNEPNA